MAWNGDAGIPEATAGALGVPVRDAARSLARVEQPNPALSALGFDIARQWRANRGSWSWVIVTGGGNDIRPDCGTARAEAAASRLVDDRLRGALPALVAAIRASGPRVAVVGYYDAAAAEPTGFTACQPQFDAMNARLARLAATDVGIVFLDAGEVIDRTDLGLYARDRIHPSPEGAARIGRALAARIAAADDAAG